MTFSIVAADRQEGEVGFAIASCCWDAGRVCMARAERGAIASQANGNLSFLPSFFEQLASGADLPSILAWFRASDDAIETRQIGMITPRGDTLAFTGNRCVPWAGHRTGEDYACQGNTLVGPGVIDAMAEAFETTEGPLYTRLYAALAAGDTVGGDIRGRQSARLTVKKAGAGLAASDRLVDIEIEDHDSPVAELGRILEVRASLVRIFDVLQRVDTASEADKPGLLDPLRKTLDDKREPRYLDAWEALALGYDGIGETTRALEAYKIYLEINPKLRALLPVSIERGDFSAELIEVFEAEGLTA